jgi:hypothetical protein
MQGLLLVNLLSALFCWHCLAQYQNNGCVFRAKIRHHHAECVMTVSLITEQTYCEELSSFLPYIDTG